MKKVEKKLGSVPIPMCNITVEKQQKYVCFFGRGNRYFVNVSSYTQTYWQADRQTDKQTGRQTDRQTDRQADRQTGRQSDSQAKSQTDRQ